MDILFGFSFIFSFLALLLGLLKPAIVMWFNLPKTRFAVLCLYFSLSILFLFLLGITTPPSEKSNNLNRKVDTLSNSKQSPKVKEYIPSDEESYNVYKARIDSIEISYKQKDIDFSTYDKNIDTLLTALDYTINERRSNKLKVFKLVQLYKKSQSKEINNTAYFLVYGPGEEGTLRASAEEFLNENALDPRSIDIQDAYKCGKQKNGWVYYVRYRAKNAYGALILTDVKLVMHYDPSSEMYNIIKAY